MSMIDVFNDNTYVSKEFFEYLRGVEGALSGDVVLVLGPAALGSSATVINAAIAGEAEKFVRTVTFTVKNAAGDTLTFFNGDVAITVTPDTVGDGTAAAEDSATKVTLVNGVGSVNIEYTGTWAAADTCTLTTTTRDIAGVATGAKTSVDTLIA